LAIGQITVMQMQVRFFVPVFVNMIDAFCGERATSTNEPMNLVVLFQQKFGKVTSILSSNAGDERRFCHGFDEESSVRNEK
jgi:hypothetical protein